MNPSKTENCFTRLPILTLNTISKTGAQINSKMENGMVSNIAHRILTPVIILRSISEALKARILEELSKMPNPNKER